jgi:hypothetical protein
MGQNVLQCKPENHLPSSAALCIASLLYLPQTLNNKDFNSILSKSASWK